MKKIFTSILTILTAAFIFAAARPSLDGRAVVADEGEMPKGLFARTIGYLPGDSVTVTNPANGSTVDVLILGSIDSSEGVAILLSPEAASRLNIRKDSNVQVKITKRTGSLDENVSGAAVLSDETEESDYFTSQLEDDTETPAVDSEPAVETESETVADDSENKTDAAVDTVSEDPADLTVENEAEAENSVEESFVPEEIPEEAVSADKFDEEVPPAAEDNGNEAVVIEGPAENVIGTTVEEQPVDEIAPETEEEVPAEKVNETAPELPADESEKIEETAPALEEESEIVNETEPETSVEENTEDEPVEDKIEDSAEQVIVEEPVENVAAEETSEEYAPIVLVPAEPNPPVEESTENEEQVEEENSTENIAAPAESVAVEEVHPAVTRIEDFVKNESELEKGKYYLQIAALGNTDNLNNIIEKYSSKYPVVFVPLTNGKGYKVLIGPLTADEYGMIIERFKSYGFKDCFLKKIK